MNPQKRTRLNAKQYHLSGTTYVTGEAVQNESQASLLQASGHSQQGPPAFCAQPDILSRGRFSKSHLYNLMARGQFPQPVIRQGPRFTRWSATDCDAWFQDPASWIAANSKTPA